MLEDLLRVERLGGLRVVLVELLVREVGGGVVQAADTPAAAKVNTVAVTVVAADVADAGDLVLDEVGPDGAVGVHLGLELGLALVGEAGQAGVVEGLGLGDVVGELHDAVDGANLVGVDVAVEDGDLVLELAVLDLLLDGRRVLHGHLLEGLVVLEVLLVGGDDEGLHLAALGGGAEGLDLGVQAVGVGLLGELRQLGVDLLLGVELVVGPDVDVAGDGLAVDVTGELVGAHVVEHARADQGARTVVEAVDAEEHLVIEGEDDVGLAVVLLGRHLDVFEEVDGGGVHAAARVLRGNRLPVLKRAAQRLVGIDRGVEQALVARERELDLALVDHLLQGLDVDVLDGEGNPVAALVGHRDLDAGALGDVLGIDDLLNRRGGRGSRGLVGADGHGGDDACGDDRGSDSHHDATLRPSPVGGLGVQDPEGPPLLSHLPLRSLIVRLAGWICAEQSTAE